MNTLYQPYQVGGAERSVEEIANFLAIENSVQILTLKSSNAKHVPKKEIINGIEVIRFALKLRYWPFPHKERGKVKRLIWHFVDLINVPIFFRVLKALRLSKPDIIMTHNLTGFSILPWVAAKMGRIPVVHVLHDYNLLCPSTTMRRDGKNCSSICIQCRPRYLVTRISPKPLALVGVSKFILNRHLNYLNLPGETLDRVAHGSASFVPPARITQPYDFGFLGGLNEAKGIDIFIEAAKSLPDHSFVIAGRENKKIEEKIAGTGNIKFLGWMDAPQFYSSINILVVPSTWNDPAPRVILEANHSGLHIVISDMPSLLEIAEYNECSFQSFESGNVESLVEVLLGALTRAPRNPKIAKEFPSQGSQLSNIITEVMTKRKFEITE